MRKGCWLAMSVVTPLVLGPLVSGAARAEPTVQSPSSAQPTLPKSGSGDLPMTSPVLGGGAAKEDKTLVVRKKAGAIATRHRRFARTHVVRRKTARLYDAAASVERPALAGVELVAPIPIPIQPPHYTVPMPAYPLENFTTFFTTPPPPVVCHRAQRDPYAPDPHLFREKTVVCDADNP